MNSRPGASSPPASALNIRSQMPRVSVGKSGPIRAHCASENQKKSDISIASSLETMNHASPALGIPLMGPDPNESNWTKFRSSRSNLLEYRAGFYGTPDGPGLRVETYIDNRER